MNNLNSLLLIALIINLGCKSEANISVDDNFKSELSQKLNEYFKTLSKIQQFNGGVYIKRDGETVLKEIYLMTEDKDSSLYADIESQFDIHSVSKLMAKACIVKMEEKGQIDRKDKLSKYIPNFPRGDEITIENLLNNESGLPRELRGEHDNLIEKSPEELVELIKGEKLLFKPGSEKLYSNLGYQLIYYIISELNGKPFVKYMDEEFFKPLKMKDTGAHFHLGKNNYKRGVTNHIKDEGVIKSVPNFEKDEKNQAKVYSTLSDLMSFIEKMKEEPYATKLKNSEGNIGWSGGGDGIRSHLQTSFRSNYDFAFFSNIDEIPFNKILEDVEKIMTGRPYKKPKEINRKSVKLDREVMQRYMGKYDMAEFNQHEFEFRVEGDSFVFYQNGERNSVVQAENDSTFFYDPKTEDGFIFTKDSGTDYKLIFKWKGVSIEGKKK